MNDRRYDPTVLFRNRMRRASFFHGSTDVSASSLGRTFGKRTATQRRPLWGFGLKNAFLNTPWRPLVRPRPMAVWPVVKVQSSHFPGRAFLGPNPAKHSLSIASECAVARPELWIAPADSSISARREGRIDFLEPRFGGFMRPSTCLPARSSELNLAIHHVFNRDKISLDTRHLTVFIFHLFN